jgi:ABC-type transport system involved in multi-copper enzyme maturation permease subunit
VKRVFIIAANEIRERRLLLVAAALLSLLPFALLLLPSVREQGSETVISSAGLIVTCSVVFGMSLFVGTSMIGRELTERRLSFYFSKPVSAASLWFGKLAGAVATLVLCGAIVAVPSILGAQSASPAPLDTQTMALFLYGGAVTLLLTMHTVATMARSRSAWLLADLVLATIAMFVTYSIFDALVAGLASSLAGAFLVGVLATVVAIMIAAGVWHLSRGRTDVRRNHVELSRFFWSATAIALLIASAFTVWITHPQPSDVVGPVGIDERQRGKWMIFGGPVRNRGGYHAAFCMNIENGATVRIDPRNYWGDAAATPDGRMRAQLVRDSKANQATVLLRRFGDRTIDEVETNVTLPAGAQLTISDDGQRVASIAGDVVQVATVADGQMLATARLPVTARGSRLFFVSGDVVRLYSVAESGVVISELDVRTRKVTHTGAFPAGVRSLAFAVNGDASRLLLQKGGLALVDGRSGAVLRETSGSDRAMFLHDDRIVGAEAGVVSFFDRDLVLQRRVALPDIARVLFAREVAPSRMLIGGLRRVGTTLTGAGWTMHLVDSNSGAVLRTERDLRPAELAVHGLSGSREMRRNIACLDAHGSVIRLDALTGARKMLVDVAGR